jgi:hypothetical protein
MTGSGGYDNICIRVDRRKESDQTDSDDARSLALNSSVAMQCIPHRHGHGQDRPQAATELKPRPPMLELDPLSSPPPAIIALTVRVGNTARIGH